jgi:hypothetical protein
MERGRRNRQETEQIFLNRTANSGLDRGQKQREWRKEI